MAQRLSCSELLDPHPILHLPRSLQDVYREELERRGVLEDAIKGTTEKNVHGGATPGETLHHFKYRFANSASRVVCILVDPAHTFASLPIEIFQSFSSHKIAVLDAPCGAGASLLSLVSVLAAARAHRELPQLPLTVSVVGADISVTALDIYKSLATQLAPQLTKHGITLDVATVQWDATHADQTSGLCDTWFANHGDANEYFVLVGNLTGVGETMVQSFQRSFTHITERISHFRSTILWIEPSITLTITKRIKEIFSLSRWLKRSEQLATDAHCRFEWRHPIENKILTGTVTVHRYERTGGNII